MNRNLLGNLEDGTPNVLDNIGCRKQGRGMFGLFLVAFFAFSLNGMVWGQTEITSLSTIANDPSGSYIIKQDISGGTTGVSTFTGTLTAQAKADGTFPVISGLTQPLFTTVTDATISNIMLKDVEISQSGNVGAIACTANGATRIYNCGILPNNPHYTDTSYVESIETKGYCGSLVGLLDGTARVINCFSFANIKGGTKVAGIVGYNNTSDATQDNYATKTIVMNCMFYGEIDTTQCDFKGASPVYGGNIIKNDGTKAINNYNYYCAASKFDSTYKSVSRYNCSWPAKVDRLRRFEYYRSILNSNRRLCAFWVTGHQVQNQTSADTALIAKWVLDPSIAPYPMLKKWGKYPSIINIDPEKVWDSVQSQWVQRTDVTAPYHGKNLGELTVTIKTGAHPGWVGKTVINNKSHTLVITDMDTTRYDYCYGKVQLPYYNEMFGDPDVSPSIANHTTRYYGNYTDSVVTGWKITAVNGNDIGTGYTFNDDWQWGCNYADRSDRYKDLYGKSGRVFAQGGYYYVPEGVSSITIEAYWGKAFYLQAKGDYLDRVDVAQTKNYGSAFTPAGTLPTNFKYFDGSSDQTVSIYNDLATIMAAVKENTTCNVYDQAIVLLSNFPIHTEDDFKNVMWNNNIGTGGVTMMSADLDMDNEPDNCFPFQWRAATTYTRFPIMPFRFDFLPIPELGMAMRHNQFAYSIGIFVPQGHFEITETAFIYTTQFEYMSAYKFNNTAPANHQKPLILNGGQFEQIVCHADNATNLTYTKNIIMGGHIWMKRFSPGSHTQRHCYVRHCAVSVMGGEFPEFYLTGIYWGGADGTHAYNDNPHCYTLGGRFGIMAGAGVEAVRQSVYFEIDHSIIREFYGGGTNANNPVKDNITVTINNSLVLDKYCGGPKIGNCKAVITNATGTIFNKYYGGGNGGTNLYRYQIADKTPDDMPTESQWRSTSGDYKYDNFKPIGDENIAVTYVTENSRDLGYHCEYEFEVFNQSNGLGTQTVARTYHRLAEFGTTRTNNIVNNLTDCTVKDNFYGGGNLGNVDGTVTSTLTDCTIKGSAFGGGYSADIPKFSPHDRDSVTFPYRDAAGVCHNGEVKYRKDWVNGELKVREYTWCNKNDDGQVFPSGVVIPNTVNTSNPTKPTFQYGGKWYCYTKKSLENLGAVSSDVTITLKGNTTVGTLLGDDTLKPNTGDVFGGGDMSEVDGNTIVNLYGSVHVLGNVYGGGNKGKVDGDSSVTIEDEPSNP